MNTEPFQVAEVCVVIPMYRAEGTIQDVLRGIPEWIARIIVVDDASPDASSAQVEALADARVVLIRHAKNQGVGGAVLTGLAKALELGAKIAVKIDADGQMDPAFLAEMVAPIAEGRADYVKGNRFFHLREVTYMPFSRRIGNLGLSFLTKLASGYWNVFDPTNGYIAINLPTFRSLEQNRLHRRFFFETSMLMELNLARAVIVEVPMPARYEGEISSLSVGHSLVEFSYHLLRGFLRRLWLTYFVLDFSPGSLFLSVGLLLGIFGTSWGLYFWDKSIRSGVPASTGTVMIAVLPVILGFQLLLQALAYDIQNVPKNLLPRHWQ